MGAERRSCQSLSEFLNEVVPVAEEAGIRLAIHPDDPPIPLFGLPRIVSTAADAAALLDAYDSRSNGLTFCVGSYGSRADNDLVDDDPRLRAAHQFPASPQRHPRERTASSTRPSISTATATWWRSSPRCSHEERRRQAEGRADAEIPMRPDHGHLLAADPVRNANPGYSYLGRLKGLAELRGVMRAVSALQA